MSATTLQDDIDLIDGDEPIDDAAVDEPASSLDEPEAAPAARKGRSVSLSVRSLGVGALILALVAGLAVMTWLYIGAQRGAAAQVQQTGEGTRAEQIALDYAVRAAVMDYKDLGPWKRALVEGTSDELGKKLTEASTAMEQILLPLEWSSSATPIAAKVRSHQDGVYIVDAFVSVMTKTIQAAENLQSTATYAVTIDPANDWKITDVGGIGQVTGQ
ncbi:hypothetical protein [Mycolicibacterium brumae]|uniref:Mammalian cell entry protein n=1 Tax=Mycolicibacterium brumae TaxID=85968 RepID=A0A2G5PCD3_9MYCO|nr:hypothetical protein [Mycolicibacterium brumae]MCV7193104.1 hypothetical protein [Mycolicibacterium brumae]PIB75967.1 hypothetical protein CQY22_007980 [Mycolicibacterium brumae]RWA16541.1 hypothetical protein MBRU_07395 [Mycolicibacterium brumae DSM 44177]UWW09760.1 hypothetical protein L2Z93_002872 [Mycolicibacterium brumae]